MIGLSQRNGPPLVPNRTVELLEQIVARLDRLEQRVEAIGALVEQAPAALAAVTDTVDEAAAQIAASGPSVDERLRAALTLADKLSRPGTVEALGRIVDRLEALEPLIGALEQLPGMAAMAAVADGYGSTTTSRSSLSMARFISSPRVCELGAWPQ